MLNKKIKKELKNMFGGKWQQVALVLVARYLGFDVESLFREEYLEKERIFNEIFLVYSELRDGLRFNIPLFTDEEIDNSHIFDFCKEMNENFKKVDPTKADKIALIKKKLVEFINKYHYSLDLIKEAYMKYLEYMVTYDNSKYIMKPSNFIEHRDKGSMLLEWINRVIESKSNKQNLI